MIFFKIYISTQSNSWQLKKDDLVLRIYFQDLGDYSSLSPFPAYTELYSTLPLP